jgi:hypothetical protein
MKTLARVASLGLLMTAVATPAFAQRSRYGVVTPMNEQNEANAAQDLGAGAVRWTLYWDNTEPSREFYDFQVLDLHLDLTVPLGRPLFISIGEQTPAWAGSCGACAPYDYNDYGNLVEAVIRHTYGRYPSADVVFGIWNEPNLPNFLNDTDDAQKYAALFQSASAARDRVSSSIRLGAPETSFHAVFSNSYFNWAMTRIGPYLHGGDIVTVHWYPDAPGGVFGYMGQVNLQAGGREMWLTEAGSGTCDDTAQLNQDSNIINNFDLSTLNWSRTFIFRLYSGGACDGLLRSDWSHRPSFDWYRDHINTIANSVVMTANQALLPDQSVVSSDGGFRLTYQLDGNLVFYRSDGYVMWASNTQGSTTGQVIMQGDGNLVLYDGSGSPLWATHTDGNPGAYLAVQNNGATVVYRPNNSMAWWCGNGVCTG